jgi:hypothetical protein
VGALARLLDTVLPGRRRRVRVRVRRDALRSGVEAYVVEVENASPGKPITVTRVWLETAVKVAITTRPLPVTIEPGERWETWIEARELMPGTTGVDRLARVALSDGTVVRP